MHAFPCSLEIILLMENVDGDKDICGNDLQRRGSALDRSTNPNLARARADHISILCPLRDLFGVPKHSQYADYRCKKGQEPRAKRG